MGTGCAPLVAGLFLFCCDLVGTGCAPLVAGLFLFCCGGDFVLSLSGGGQADIIEAFGSASGCLDDLLGVGGPCFGRVVGRMCPAGLRLGGASSGTGAPFLDLGLSMADGVVSSEICGGLDDFNFEVVGFPFLDGDVPRSPSCGVYISQLIPFARVCSSVDGFGSGGLFLTAELLKQGCGCHTV